MNAPIASPFGDSPNSEPPLLWPQHLHWDTQQRCFALRYRSPVSAKLRCLPKELRRSPLQILLLFVMSPVWFFWLFALHLPLAMHVLLSLVMAPIGILGVMILQWNLNKSPGLAMIRSDGLADQFPAKTTFYGWADFKGALENDGDLFFYATATKGSYFPREAFASRAEAELFFYLVESLMRHQGANWRALAEKFAPQLPQA